MAKTRYHIVSDLDGSDPQAIRVTGAGHVSLVGVGIAPETFGHVPKSRIELDEKDPSGRTYIERGPMWGGTKAFRKGWERMEALRAQSVETPDES